MTDAAGDLVVQVALYARTGWLLIPTMVGGTVRVNMVLDTAALVSSLSVPTFERLSAAGSLEPLTATRFLIREVSIQGQVVRPIEVRVSQRVTQVGADGILGLDFLGRFTDIHFRVPSLRLTLRG